MVIARRRRERVLDFKSVAVQVARHFRSHIYVKNTYIDKFNDLWEKACTAAIRNLKDFTTTWQMTQHFAQFKRNIASMFFDVEVNRRLLERYENQQECLDDFQKIARIENCKELIKVTKAKSYYLFVEVIRCLKKIRNDDEKERKLTAVAKHPLFPIPQKLYSTPKTQKGTSSPGKFNRLLINREEKKKQPSKNALFSPSISEREKMTPSSKGSPIRAMRRINLKSNTLSLIKSIEPTKAFALNKYVDREDDDEVDLSPSRHVPKSRIIMGIKSVQSAQEIALEVHKLKLIVKSNSLNAAVGNAQVEKPLLKDIAKNSPTMGKLKRSLSIYSKIVEENTRSQMSMKYAVEERQRLLQIICDKLARRSRDRLHCNIDEQSMADIVMCAFIIVTKYEY